MVSTKRKIGRSETEKWLVKSENTDTTKRYPVHVVLEKTANAKRKTGQIKTKIRANG